MSRYNLRPRHVVAAPKKIAVSTQPSYLPSRTWKTLVAAAAIIENKMPEEVVHDVKHLYAVLKSLAAFKHQVEKCDHLWQYRTAMINHETALIHSHLHHIEEHPWYYSVIDLFRKQNYSAILSCLHSVIETHEHVANLEELIDAVSIGSNDMEED